jgi:hypothetical protein
MDSLVLAADRSVEDGGARLMHRWLPLPDGRGSDTRGSETRGDAMHARGFVTFGGLQGHGYSLTSVARNSERCFPSRDRKGAVAPEERASLRSDSLAQPAVPRTYDSYIAHPRTPASSLQSE